MLNIEWNKTMQLNIVMLQINPLRTKQAPQAWYYFGRILFKTSTPLHQMGFLECQIEHLRKIYTSLE